MMNAMISGTSATRPPPPPTPSPPITTSNPTNCKAIYGMVAMIPVIVIASASHRLP